MNVQDRLYTVTELARELGVTPRAIRFYEEKSLINPQRAGAARVYTHRDRARMKLILRGKRLGFSLREIQDYLSLYDADASRREQTRLLLRRVGARLAKLEEQRQAVQETLAELHEIKTQAEAALETQKPKRAMA